MAKVYITRRAMKVIMAEVKFFAKQGNKEAIVYPMFGFIRSEECMKAPWEMLELSDIDSFLVTHARAPIRDFCAHAAARAKYQFANEEQRSAFRDDIDRWSSELGAKYPSLEMGNVHSHPFSHFRTWPSSGGKTMDYHRIHNLWERMKSRKVNTPLEIILCRNFFTFRSWVACCFGFDSHQKIVSFGNATVVSDNNKIVRQVLTTPYYATDSGIKWEKLEREKCSEIEAIDRFCFGWSAIRLKISSTLYAYVSLPLQFPNVDAVLFNTLNTETKTWSKMQKYHMNNLGYNFSLKEIFKKIREGGLNE